MFRTPEFKKFKQVAVDAKYTPKDVLALTKEQIAIIVDLPVDDPKWSSGNEGFFRNLQEWIAKEIESLNLLRTHQRIEELISAEFPNAIVHRGCVLSNRPYIQIFLENAPLQAELDKAIEDKKRIIRAEKNVFLDT